MKKRAIHLVSAMFSPRCFILLSPLLIVRSTFAREGEGGGKKREESSLPPPSPPLLQRKIPVLLLDESIYKPLINRRLEETITLTATNDSHSFGS